MEMSIYTFGLDCQEMMELWSLSRTKEVLLQMFDYNSMEGGGLGEVDEAQTIDLGFHQHSVGGVYWDSPSSFTMFTMEDD